MIDTHIQPKLFLPPKTNPPSLSEYLTDRLNRLQPSPEALVLIAALIIGGGSGLIVVLFRYLIALFQTLSFEKLLGTLSIWGGWTLLLIPTLGGVLIGMMKWLFPQVLGQDFYTLISSTREPKIAPWRPALKMLAASISLGTGASLGPESPSVEIGANIGIILAQLFQVSKDRYRLLLGAGAAAGLAAGFNAPIAGVFFALEVVLGTAFTTPAASLILLSAFISAATASSILGIHPALELPTYQVFSYWEWFFYLGLGLLASLIAFIYTQGIKLAQASFRGEITIWQWQTTDLAQTDNWGNHSRCSSPAFTSSFGSRLWHGRTDFDG
jgi:H+/Cl- antiporter ClcA